MNRRVPLLIVMSLFALVCSADVGMAHDGQSDVPALFAARCVRCHGPGEAEAGLRLDDRDFAVRPLDSGVAAIVPGDPASGVLLDRVSDPDDPMPPEGERLTEAEIESIRQWIAEGAVWKPHWAYRKLDKPQIPAAEDVSSDNRTGNPIDAFVRAKQSELGLQSSTPADRRTLLRRLYYDLIGLPPSPREMDAFLSDRSINAYERVVDRLLASPHYGERWARHWMDVVHYADSHGFEHDLYRDSWPYRDYVIRSLNEDKPYAQFVQEQVAGDVLFPENPQALVATGFLATGPWDLSALKAGNPESIDYLISQYLDRDDIVSTVMATFVSCTVECARCHDHKFDPISQSDYYNLQAVFAGIDKATRDYDPDPQVAQERAELKAHKTELEAQIARQDPALLESSLQDAALDWLRQQPQWTILEPVTYDSASGVTLVKEADGSLLSTGTRPDTDIYTVQVQAPIVKVTAIRLELLADPRLPLGGPGRQENGNLHLNELTLAVESASDPGVSAEVELRAARADYNQPDWSVDQSIDGNLATAWGIYPNVGQSHVAYFELAEPLVCDENTRLTFKLQQSHGRGHLVGRFRLAAIHAEHPESLVIDTQLTALIETLTEEQLPTERIKLAGEYLRRTFDEQLAALPVPQRLYCGTNQFAAEQGHRPADVPRPIHVLERGSVHAPGPLAVPGALSCMPTLDAKLAMRDLDSEGERRAALAAWLADTQNVLTWRSIANRIWHFHFGRGLVATPSDFGKMGSLPTHPELLDWLAVGLQENEGSLKWLHRQIVTSKTYQQSSQFNPQSAETDSSNRYLWRMSRKMLDAEAIRDSLLQFSGKLNAEMGGPPVKHFVVTKNINDQEEPAYSALDVDDAGYFRRSVYRYIYRTMPEPFMNAMDCPDASQRTPVRSHSVTALQAAAMLNDPFLVRQCEHIANRIASTEAALQEQVVSLYTLIYGRNPEAEELQATKDYADAHGLANACRVLLNSNEFLFVD